MKKSKKTKGYEAVPARMSITLMPEPILTGQSKPNFKEIQFHTARSFSTSVRQAEVFTQGKLTECRRFIRQSNLDKFNRVIHSTPTLQESPYVQEMLRLYQKRMHGSRGRPTGLYSFNPTVIAGLVRQTVSTGQASNKEKAFHLAADLIGTSYDVIKRHFYQAVNADKFQTTLVETGEAREVTAEEMQKLAFAHTIFNK